MGCFATKNEVCNILLKTYLGSNITERSPQKVDHQTSASTCEEMGGLNRSLKLKMQQCERSKRSNCVNLNLQRILSDKLLAGPTSNYYQLISPGLENLNYGVVCEEKFIPFFTHLLYGFPAENVHILVLNCSKYEHFLMPNRKRIIAKKPKEHENIEKLEVHMLLKLQTCIFIKLKVKCQRCSKVTIITQCRVFFHLDHLNCNCVNNFITVNVVIAEPKLLQIWSQELQQVIFTPHQKKNNKSEILLKRQSKFRIFGCTSCWGFYQLQQRDNCGCAVCSQCEDLNCQLCMIIKQF